jgi:hypothetical protein
MTVRNRSRRPSIDRLIRDEVVAPDVVRVERAIHIRRALVRATPLPLLTDDLETFPLTDQPETISADRKAFTSQDRMDLPTAEARIATREFMDTTNELRLFDPA